MLKFTRLSPRISFHIKSRYSQMLLRSLSKEGEAECEGEAFVKLGAQREKGSYNPLMHKVPKWDKSKNLAVAFAARFLTCVRPFWDVMY